MKKIYLIYFLIALFLFVNTFALQISDDFNRPDNENISEGYEGDFVWYEYPINIEGQIPYTAQRFSNRQWINLTDQKINILEILILLYGKYM
ncbi:hypothetical protein HOA56_02775 [archaeon]|nr:hypothetical protein [archaeon]MBT6821326.1 hypothetical protein [archaeon]